MTGGPLIPPGVNTLGGMLDAAAERHPGRQVRTFFRETNLPLAELVENGRTAARNLIAAGVTPGAPVLVIVPDNLQMLRVIAGLAHAGAAMVPLSVPLSVSKTYLARLRHVIEDCGVRHAVTDASFAGQFAEQLPDIEVIDSARLLGPVPRRATFAPSRRPARPLAAPDENPSTSRPFGPTTPSGRRAESTLPHSRLRSSGGTPTTPLLDGQTLPAAAPAGDPTGELPVVHPDDLALIQYTSGSTSAPKGVALSHRNVLAGLRALHHGTGATPDDVACLWLPLSHDMGLFSTLAALAGGLELHLSPPQDFVKHPDDWLRRVAECRATILVGPDFSYRHLMDAVDPEEAAAHDLSSVRVVLNGAEPIDPLLAPAFAEHFAASGLAPQAMTPCYGLAEATLAVTFSALDGLPEVDWVDRDILNNLARAKPVRPGTPQARGIVGCGAPVPGIEVRIAVDGQPQPERAVGEIEIRGEPVMRGYHRERTPALSPDGWCPTGDLGYLADGRLHVTGRKKEMMILGGQNYYPQDIEAAVRRVAGVHKGNAVAVVLPADPATGRPERIGVLAEAAVATGPYDTLVAALRKAAADELGGQGVDVVLLRRNALLRTTSGKFQRLLMRQQLLDGTLNRILVRVAAGERLVPVEVPVEERSLSSSA